MALHEIQFSTTNRPALHLIHPYSDGAERLDFSPAYQRGSVWTTEQRVNLIMSLMQGLPIGAVFLNLRGGDVMQPLRVVDGKQRLETLVAWSNDELAVPREWFTDEYVDLRHHGDEMVCASGLSDVGRRIIQNRWLLAVYETRLPDEAAERELYERINYGGTPHEPLPGPGPTTV
jgi:hypothetical protein